MTRKPLIVLPDTNSLLHFKRPDQVDWKAVVGRTDVEIVLSPVPVQEIDKHARLHDVARIRAKARDLKSWIRSLLKAEGNVRIDSREPTQFLTGGLDPQVPDDRLIASALMLHAEGHEVAIYTDDTLIHAKANGRPIRAVFPPDEDRLKEEPDAVGKKVETLQRELNALKSRQPRATLGWASGEHFAILTIGEAYVVDVPSPAEERHRLRPLEDPGTLTGHRSSNVGLDLSRLRGLPSFGPSRSQVLEYNDALETYHHEYGRYFRSLERLAEIESRIVELHFKAGNDGSAPASSFRASATLPRGFVLLEHREAIGKRPRPPRPPVKPGVYGLIEEGRRHYSDDFPFVGYNPAGLVHESLWDDSPYVHKETNVIELRRSKLLQHNPFVFDPAFAVVKPNMVGVTGAIEFRLTAEELSAPLTVNLPFRIEREP